MPRKMSVLVFEKKELKGYRVHISIKYLFIYQIFESEDKLFCYL